MANIALIGLGAIGSIIARSIERSQHTGYYFTTTPRQSLSIKYENSLNETYSIDSYTLHDEQIETIFNQVDLIIIATKATSNHTILKKITPYLNQDTPILFAQNGMGQTEQYNQSVPSVVYISGEQLDDKSVIHFQDQMLILPNTEHSQIIYDLLNSDDLTIVLSERFTRHHWKKILVNLGINSITAITMSTCHIVHSQYAVEWLTEIIREGQSVCPIDELKTDNFRHELIQLYQSYSKEMGTSMYYDLLNEKQTEVEFIQGYLLRYAKSKKIDTPYIQSAYSLIKAKDSINQQLVSSKNVTVDDSRNIQ